ncbi:MAG: sugar phosphate isomerase/epimerase, partial [Bacteroidota bacterium]
YLMKGERSSIDDYKKYCEALNEAAGLCQSAGIQLCYHNHSFEFESIEGQVPYEMLIERLDPRGVQFELDVFWAQIGGYDPVALTQRLSDRIRLLHLKDLQPQTPVIFDEGAVPHEAFLELGNGMIDLEAIVRIANQANIKYCFVEQDWSDHPLQSVEQSVDYFQKMKTTR